MLRRTRREFERKYCLHPEAPNGCSKKIASAHSVQRALLKKFISEKGHVVQIKTSVHAEPVGLLAKPELIGINDATTFSGFCSKHDSDLFHPLETSEFSFTRHQITLLGYRAICRELYSKDAEIAAADSVWSYCSVNPDIAGFHEKRTQHQITQIARHNSRANLLQAKELFTKALTDNMPLCFYCVEFSEPPVYLNSVAFLPEWDFECNRLQDLNSITEYKPICFSAWAAYNHATAVFCWHESANDICIPFIDSLRRSPAERLANRILSMAFEVSDNVAFQAEWWESISETDRRLIVNRAFSGVGRFDRKRDCMADDGLQAISCAIVNEHVGYPQVISSHNLSRAVI